MTEAKLISALNEENLSHFSKTYVPSRLLLGPGPSNAHPEVLSALSLNPIGHLDEAYISLMSDVQQLLRYTWQCNNRLTLPMSGTGSAAMEASGTIDISDALIAFQPLIDEPSNARPSVNAVSYTHLTLPTILLV